MAIRSLSHPYELPGPGLQPGTRLRRARERLGLTYRDVERASYELACQRGRPDFIVHLSRLADIENRDVTPAFTNFTLWPSSTTWIQRKFAIGMKCHLKVISPTEYS